MLSINENQTVYVYNDPVDMRKAINGLSMILQEDFDKNPQSGDVYIFTNRARNKVKCLVWDKNGFVLYYKRLERGRFNYSKYMTDDELVVTKSQLKGLLMGLDFYLLGEQQEDVFTDYF